MALLGAIGAGASLLNELGLDLSGNPKDRERAENANELRDEAISYGRGSERGLAAYAKLRCLSGIGRIEDRQFLDEHPQYQGAGSGCVGGGWATNEARAYGQTQVKAVEDAWATQPSVGGVSAPVQNAAQMYAAASAGGMFGDVPPWMLLAGAALLLYALKR